MSVVNAFLMECAASPDSPFPASSSRPMAHSQFRRSSDGGTPLAGDEDFDIHTPPALSRKMGRGGSPIDGMRHQGPTPPSQGSAYNSGPGSQLSYKSISSSSSKALTDASTLASGGSSAQTPMTNVSSGAGTSHRKVYGSALSKGASPRTLARTTSAPAGNSLSHLKDYEGKLLMRDDQIASNTGESPTFDRSRPDEVSTCSIILSPSLFQLTCHTVKSTGFQRFHNSYCDCRAYQANTEPHCLQFFCHFQCK